MQIEFSLDLEKIEVNVWRWIKLLRQATKNRNQEREREREREREKGAGERRISY